VSIRNMKERVASVVSAGRFLGVSLLILSVSGCITPKALTQKDIAQAGRERLAEFESRRQTLGDGISLPEAMSWAMERNLSLRAESLERAIAVQNRKLATAGMLPSIAAQAGYRWRDNVAASSSQNVTTGVQSLVPSTSSERTGITSQLEASWNVLDFGLAWVRARSEGDKVFIAEESRRRMSQQIALDVAYAWERAATFQRVEPTLRSIRLDVSRALAKLDRIEASGLTDKVGLLESRTSLLLVLKRMDAQVLQMDQARDELSRLLGLPAGEPIRLDNGDGAALLQMPQADLRAWQYAALLNRPEVRQVLYAKRNAERNTYRRMLEQFPSLLIKFGTNYDSNQFLVNNQWEDASASLSLNLLKLATIPINHRLSKIEKEQAEIQAELQVAAVLSQVAIAHKAVVSSMRQACLGEELKKTSEQRLSLLDARYKMASLDELSLVRARVDDLLLTIEHDLGDLDAHHAMLLMMQSIGIGMWPEKISGSDDEKTQKIAKWLQGGMTEAVGKELNAAENELGLNDSAVMSENKTAQEIETSESGEKLLCW
jgi:outer membrane protein TolC